MGTSRLEQYLSELIVTANDVLDFPAHTVLIFEPKKRHFESRHWHYLEGYYVPKRGFEPQQLYQTILESRRSRIGPMALPESSGGMGQEEMDTSGMFVPLHIDDRPVALLALSAPENEEFTQYDAFLADSVASVVATAFSPSHDYRAPMRFCMLQRRQFMAAEPTLAQVLAEYLRRMLTSSEFRLLPKRMRASANFRIVVPAHGNGGQYALRYFSFLPTRTRQRSQAIAKEHVFAFPSSKLNKWLHRWTAFSRKPPSDIDPGYKDLFPDASTHIPIPCLCRGRLYGILSVDSPRDDQLDPVLVRALCVVGAQAAPTIKAALERERLETERREHSVRHKYLQAVLDAIPDEVSIIDGDCRIVMMNREKKSSFPRADIGEYCYKAYEGKDWECEGCHTMRSLRTGVPIRKALWKYTDVKTKETRYVEISSGQISAPEGDHKGQAVEVVRPVDARERMLEWLADVHTHLISHLDKPEEGVQWLWSRIADGLEEMGFSRTRVYTFESSRFRGSICRPATACKRKDFTRFWLDPEKDPPSRVLLDEAALRPVRFLVNPDLKEGVAIEGRETLWNYATYYLRQIPAHCRRDLDKGEIWVDVPIGVPGRLYGKMSVDKGTGPRSDEKLQITDFEVSLLAAFGRFASLAMQILFQASELVRAEKAREVAEFARVLAHDSDNCLMALGTSAKLLAQETPSLIEQSLSFSRRCPNGDLLEMIALIHCRMSEASLLMASSLDRQQSGLVSRLRQKAQRAGVTCSREDVTPLVLANVDSEFLELVDHCTRRHCAEPIVYVLSLGKMLSRLQTTMDKYQTAASLMNNLRAHSMLDPTTIEPTSLEESVDGAVRILRASLPSRAKVRVLKPATKLRPIPSYAGAFRFVWINLLKNAIVATEGKGRVVVRVFATRHAACVEVSDDGPGLPMEIVELINAPAPRRGAIGARHLGLKSVKMIAEAHGGDVRIVSTGKGGTTLEVRLPFKGADR